MQPIKENILPSYNAAKLWRSITCQELYTLCQQLFMDLCDKSALIHQGFSVVSPNEVTLRDKGKLYRVQSSTIHKLLCTSFLECTITSTIPAWATNITICIIRSCDTRCPPFLFFCRVSWFNAPNYCRWCHYKLAKRLRNQYECRWACLLSCNLTLMVWKPEYFGQTRQIPWRLTTAMVFVQFAQNIQVSTGLQKPADSTD